MKAHISHTLAHYYRHAPLMLLRTTPRPRAAPGTNVSVGWSVTESGDLVCRVANTTTTQDVSVDDVGDTVQITLLMTHADTSETKHLMIAASDCNRLVAEIKQELQVQAIMCWHISQEENNNNE